MKDDTISIAAALNLVKDVCEAILSGCGSHYDGEDEVYDDLLEADAILKCNKEIMTALKHLPSAQSESCEYYALCRHGRDENKLRARLGFCEYCNEDADGYVKPIEKNCHAFIRFGMNGWELSLKANGWHGSAKIRYCPMCGRDLYVKGR